MSYRTVHVCPLLVGTALFGGIAERTAAQVVYPPVVVFEDDHNYFEPTIAVDVAGPQGNAHKILVAAIRRLTNSPTFETSKIAYAISLDGGQTFVNKGFLEAPGQPPVQDRG
ncbi:MAG: hypothetical protein KJZ54_09970 [Phycisphaerales bacterium]|nr:hypothetical protein [Phycisphaerales bacterium]